MEAKQLSYDETADEEETDDDAEPCTQGEMLDTLVAEGIADYQDPVLTLKVSSIVTPDDFQLIEQLGWQPEVFHEGNETLITVHQK